MEERRETITVEEKEELEGAPPSDSIKVSNNRSLFFYVDLATKFLLSHETVDISGLGGAIPTVVTIAEILKNQDVAKITCICSSHNIFSNLYSHNYFPHDSTRAYLSQT
eukprot:TRINITY_DN1053_c0_g2_i2.p1 TRINITY_DN1053_c0_g2~~TRINITY_DN1053_c0_g2_i2.p1  ORF type:complete len:109 (+),score=17.83 TRINITY_DN1053_c0_g2_i2:62-388(+)